MTEGSWQHVWMEQCDAAEGIRLHYGLEAAFDYAVGEKLLEFAEAAARNPDFARELPPYVSHVRNMFTADEIRTHLARIERLRQPALTDDEFDELDHENPRSVLKKQRQFDLLKELLAAPTFGTPEQREPSVVKTANCFDACAHERHRDILPQMYPRSDRILPSAFRQSPCLRYTELWEIGTTGAGRENAPKRANCRPKKPGPEPLEDDLILEVASGTAYGGGPTLPPSLCVHLNPDTPRGSPSAS